MDVLDTIAKVKECIEAKDDPQALFQSSLIRLNDLSLWQVYLNFIRETNAAQLVQAHEFALDHCGIDYYSTHVWQEYIDALAGNFDAVRRAYHRCTSLPLNQLDQLWRAYEQFEQQQNQPQMVSDRAALYVNAKSKCRLLQAFTDAVPKHSLKPTPQLHVKVQEWAQMEMANPLNYQDTASVDVRVAFVYKYALCNCFHRSSAMWLDYMLALPQVVDQKLLQWATEACPMAVVLHARVAELLVSNSALWQGREPRAVFEDQLSRYDTEIQQVRDLIAAGSTDTLLKQENDLIAQANCAWCLYMKLMRRSEGQKSTRLIFSRARKTQYADHPTAVQIFRCSAMMEFWAYNDRTVSFKIFEVGMKQARTDVAYIACYLDHLLLAGEVGNARALFERTVTHVSQSVSMTAALPLWTRMLSYESEYGDAMQFETMDRRFRQAYNYGNTHQWLVGKMCHDLPAIYEKEFSLTSTQLPPFFSLRPSVVSAAGGGGAGDGEDLYAGADQLLIRGGTGTSSDANVVLPVNRDEERQYPPVNNPLSMTIPDSRLHRVGARAVRPNLKQLRLWSPGEPSAVHELPPKELVPPVPQQQQHLNVAVGPAMPLVPQAMPMQPMLPPQLQALLQLFPQHTAHMWQGKHVSPDMLLDTIRNAQLVMPVGYLPGQIIGAQLLYQQQPMPLQPQPQVSKRQRRE